MNLFAPAFLHQGIMKLRHVFFIFFRIIITVFWCSGRVVVIRGPVSVGKISDDMIRLGG